MIKKIYHDGDCIGFEEVADEVVFDTNVEVDPPKEQDDVELDQSGDI